VTTENLRANLDALPGVASAEVTLNDDAVPLARVWLDGSVASDDVRDLVDGLVANSMPSVVLPRQKTPRRRIGLGRGLVDLLPTEESDRVPLHFQPSVGRRQSIVAVAVIESHSGVIVEIESNVGVVHTETVAESGDVDLAVVRSVAAVAGVGEDIRMDIADFASAGGSIVLVSAFRDGKRAVGAAFIEYGRPYAIARAGLAALHDL
jgi:hypothetical protein